jgi:hypothetical protein
MEKTVVASFEVASWVPRPGEDEGGGPVLTRAIVTKTFEGDLSGESRAELLMCQADPEDLTAGAGYVASEQFHGSLDGRRGSFVIHHWGVSEVGGRQRTSGHVVPGSGTGDLDGLRGQVEISVDESGKHTLRLTYHLR